MVHGFAVQSGGAMRLSSQLGLGTIVELWLPRTIEQIRETVAGETAAHPPAGPAARSLRILLVDDDPLVVAGTSSMLEELGHDAITVAASGEDALAVLRDDSDFDLLLTDHMMPGMSGVQLAAQARELHKSLPILIASGFAELDETAGMTWPRLRKPYSLNDLATALVSVAHDVGAAEPR
jgi:CheY-like chemotaxis protein